MGGKLTVLQWQWCSINIHLITVRKYCDQTLFSFDFRFVTTQTNYNLTLFCKHLDLTTAAPVIVEVILPGVLLLG